MENNILATVNERQITEKDVDVAIARFPKDRQGYLSTDNGRKQVLEQLVSFELFYNYAKDNNIESDPHFIEQFEAAKKEILTQIAIDKVLSSVKVEDDEVRDYYEANKERFQTPESVTAKHILVDSQEKALQIKEEIKAGKSFEDAALEYSSCPSKEQGGNLGNFTKGQMVPEFENSAFTLEVGVVSEPVKTQFGYHLIKVEEKNEHKAIEFETIKNKIANQILQERQNYKFMNVTDELKAKYNVKFQ